MSALFKLTLEIAVAAVAAGAFMFMGDLARTIDRPLEVDGADDRLRAAVDDVGDRRPLGRRLAGRGRAGPTAAHGRATLLRRPRLVIGFAVIGVLGRASGGV